MSITFRMQRRRECLTCGAPLDAKEKLEIALKSLKLISEHFEDFEQTLRTPEADLASEAITEITEFDKFK